MTSVLSEIVGEISDTQHGRYLTFDLGKEVFGIEIKYVTEIVGLQNINPLPDAPDYIKGLINLRGSIIPVIDMRLRLKKEPVAYNDRTCIVVINITDLLFGLIVDQVDEVLMIDDNDIVLPPGSKAGYQSRYIKGIGKSGNGIRLLLDCEKLFTEELDEVIMADE